MVVHGWCRVDAFDVPGAGVQFCFGSRCTEWFLFVALFSVWFCFIYFIMINFIIRFLFIEINALFNHWYLIIIFTEKLFLLINLGISLYISTPYLFFNISQPYSNYYLLFSLDHMVTRLRSGICLCLHRKSKFSYLFCIRYFCRNWPLRHVLTI